MSTKTNTATKQTKKDTLEGLRLPELWERFKEATGESSRSPNRKFLVRRIEEALEARATTEATSAASASPPPSQLEPQTPESGPMTGSSAPTKQRGRFASMTVEELQAKYVEVVGRETGSDDRRYLIWKIREAEKGRVPVGPRKSRERAGEPVDVRILPLRLEADVADKMDEAWRSRGIKTRMEFFRRALGHYLAHLGAHDASVHFVSE